MNKTFTPHTPIPNTPGQDYFMVRWSELEIALTMLAAPSKQAYVAETLSALRMTSRDAGQGKEIFSVIAATAWLIDDEASSNDVFGR